MVKELRQFCEVRSRCFPQFLCLLLPILLFLSTPTPAWSQGDGRMLHIKAAFTYRFLLFTRWPAQATTPDSIRVGIVANDAMVRLFKGLSSEQRSKKKIEVLPLPVDASAKMLRSCQLLYIPAANEGRVPAYLKQVAGYPVLTISDSDIFLEQGGMITLFRLRNNIRFSINRKKANAEGISFSSQMLKMASHILENEDDK